MRLAPAWVSLFGYYFIFLRGRCEIHQYAAKSKSLNAVNSNYRNLRSSHYVLIGRVFFGGLHANQNMRTIKI